KSCSRPCCTSSSCDPQAGFVCWTSPEGGVSFCRDASAIGRSLPGTAASGQPCEEDSACRSGRCDEGTCADLCCSSTSCVSADGTCRFGKRAESFGFFCAPTPAGKRSFAAVCTDDDDCVSGLCIPFRDGVQRCSSPCCSSGD